MNTALTVSLFGLDGATVPARRVLATNELFFAVVVIHFDFFEFFGKLNHESPPS